MCYVASLDTILVARTTAPYLILINPFDGSSTGTTGFTGFDAGGSAAFSKVRATPDGTVYGCNKVSNDTASSFRIFRWTDLGPNASCSVIYRNRASNANVAEGSPIGPTLPNAPVFGATTAWSIGDSFYVVKNGSNVDFYMGVMPTAGSTGLNFIYVLHSTDAGATITTFSCITMANPFVTSTRGIAIDTTVTAGSVIYNFGSDGLYTWDTGAPTATRTVFPANFSAAFTGSPGVGVWKNPATGKKYCGFVASGSMTGSANGYNQGILTDVTLGVASVSVVDITDNIAAPNSNIASIPSEFDVDTVRTNFLYLAGNNFVGSYSLPPAGVTKYWNAASGS